MAAERQVQPFPHITRTPGTCGGEPRIDGTRIPVRCVVIEYRLAGNEISAVEQAYPHLDVTEIEEALAFYKANRVEIDSYIEENERFSRTAD